MSCYVWTFEVSKQTNRNRSTRSLYFSFVRYCCRSLPGCVHFSVPAIAGSLESAYSFLLLHVQNMFHEDLIWFTLLLLLFLKMSGVIGHCQYNDNNKTSWFLILKMPDRINIKYET